MNSYIFYFNPFADSLHIPSRRIILFKCFSGNVSELTLNKDDTPPLDLISNTFEVVFNKLNKNKD